MNVKQFRELIVRPALLHIALWSPEAENLVIGTALQESGGLRYIKQLGNGPALGFFQCEPFTYQDIWTNYLAYNATLADKLRSLAGSHHPELYPDLLIYNLRYAAAMCRVHYLRAPGAIPKDLLGIAEYWKLWYNTPLGKGTAQEFIHNYQAYSEG